MFRGTLTHALRRAALPGLAAALMLSGLGGCESDARDPSRPLSADEGEALLKDIRSDRGRMESLTPAERQYLYKSLRKK